MDGMSYNKNTIGVPGKPLVMRQIKSPGRFGDWGFLCAAGEQRSQADDGAGRRARPTKPKAPRRRTGDDAGAADTGRQISGVSATNPGLCCASNPGPDPHT